MTFDPKRRLVMASFKTVLGHNLPAGFPLAIVEEPSARGEVDEALARRLHSSKVAVYAEEAHATPVETPEQERARLAAEALRDAPADQPDALTATDDLVVWQENDRALNRRKGDKVTNADLRAIAAREGVVVEGDDNKADLTRKIMERRAQAAVVNGTNAETDGAGTQGDTAAQGSTAPATTGGADTGADGDAHGSAGEGQSDAGE